MKILKQEPVKSYRTKKVEEFINKWFPVKPIGILVEMKLNERKNNGHHNSSN